MSRVLKHLLKDEDQSPVEKIELDISEVQPFESSSKTKDVSQEQPKLQRPQLISIPKLVVEEPEQPKRRSRKKENKIVPPPFKHQQKIKPMQLLMLVLVALICGLYAIRILKSKTDEPAIKPNVPTEPTPIPEDPMVAEHNRNREAINLFHDQKFEEALVRFKDIALHYPNSPSAQTNLGMTYFRLGQLEEAKTHLLSALQLNPKDVIAYNDLGMVSIKEKDYFMAVSYFEKAIQVSPSFPDSHLNLGKAHEQMGKPEKAILEYETYVNLPTGDPVVKKVLGKRISKLRSMTRYFHQDQKEKEGER